MVLAHWGVNVTEADVRRILKTKPYSGTQAINLLQMFIEAWGFSRQMMAIIEPHRV